MTALNKQALRSREEFEEYYNETHAVKVTSQFKRFGYYVSPTMQKAWELWQKAQSSMRDELEAAEKRIDELSASHSKLRDTMATIHNTIRMDGGYTPLAAILNAAKRAHEESAIAAGIGVRGD